MTFPLNAGRSIIFCLANLLAVSLPLSVQAQNEDILKDLPYDESFIQEAVAKVLNDNPSEVEKYLAGKDTLLQWFMGQISRATKGKADPNVAKELLIKGFEERRK